MRDIADPVEREAHHAALIAPVERGLDELPSLSVSPGDAARLRRGQSIILRGRDAPIMEGHVTVFAGAELVAIGDMQGAELRPHRVFQFAS